jgi:signal transduction histidine kinase
MPELTFSVDSALLSELGEKLVETAHIALVELVKNAYDADATEVTVKIVPQEGRGPEIQVIDDGVGMTFSEVERYWMRIATTHKQDQQVSRLYGRFRTGSKGIGRFSCRRLGARLKLVTTAAKNGHFERTEVAFDWLKFKPGKEISEVTCEGHRRNLDSAETGTTLIISEQWLDEWRKRGYDFLKRQLAVLTANRGRKRPGFREDPGFGLRLEAPGFNEVISNLRERLLTAGWGDLTVKVNAEGEVNCKLEALRIGGKTIKYPQKLPNLAGTTARIGLMPDVTSEMRNRDILSKGTLSSILDQWGGVYVRYKGFRVYPYGEPGNDWLNIDRDRGIRKGGLSDILQPFAARLRGVSPQRALLSLLSNKAHIGDVEIGERATGFELKASREGFVGESAIGALREVVRFAIDWATMYRDYSRTLSIREEARRARAELEKQTRQPVESREVFATAIRVVESEVRNLATQLPTAERQQVLRSLRTATEAIAKHEASSREELRHLQLIASTSTLLLIFSHEVKALLSWLEQISISLEGVRRKLKQPEAGKIAAISEEFGTTKQRFVDLLSMTSLISVNSREAEPQTLTLRPRLERAKRCFDLILKNYDIDVDVEEVPRALQVGPMLEAELYAVLLNILSNAIKSVIAAGGKKRVQVTAEKRASQVVMHVLDSGVGLEETHFEDVFSPFVADPEKRLYRGLDSKLNPEDQYIVGTGSGLGLSIVREILSNRNGSISFKPPNRSWKADVEVVLP